MRGRWAAGIMPRNFCWIIQDRLAVSERPGGQAPHHRRVRRQEEILWIRGQGFSRIVSLLPSNHNLHAYDELGVTSSHFPVPVHADIEPELSELYPALHSWLRDGERLLVHQEVLGDRLAGVMAGYLCWSGLLPEPPRAIAAAEQLMRRQLGTVGRSIVAVAAELARQRHSGVASDVEAGGGAGAAPGGEAGGGAGGAVAGDNAGERGGEERGGEELAESGTPQEASSRAAGTNPAAVTAAGGAPGPPAGSGRTRPSRSRQAPR